jgi:aminoglycoside/choline kinase family phosphotransferase
LVARAETIEADRFFSYSLDVNTSNCAESTLHDSARRFLLNTPWSVAACEPLSGDASARHYFRLRQGKQTAILMDASQNLESVATFIRIGQHLRSLGFSAPAILASNEGRGLLLLEDFGDDTFAQLLERGCLSRSGNAAAARMAAPLGLGSAEQLFALATDVLIALHKHPEAIPSGLRRYHPQKMLEDIELFLDWRAPGISSGGKEEFRANWREVLPLAHHVPGSLLLRDYHVANLMLLPDRVGTQQAGLLDFQDAYQGPITYDLVSLLQDARRDLPEGLEAQMLARYLARFPALDPRAVEISLAILAAQRHTRVLAIFERLSGLEGKHDYKRLHAPRVERQLRKALRHPALAGVSQWMQRYVWKD